MHNPNNLKQKFKNLKHIYGAWTAVQDSTIAEMFASILRPDLVVVDFEHSVYSLSNAKDVFSAVQAHGCSAFARISYHERSEITRLLDAGADGLIIPSLRDADELAQIINAFKYPPIGKRGYGVSRAQGYGTKFEDYAKSWNRDSVLVIIIETLEALENIEELVSNEHVDGIIIGGYDLSGALGVPGQIKHNLVEEAINKVASCCKKYKKTYGILLDDVNQVTIQHAQEIANLVILSTDILIFKKWLEDTSRVINQFNQID